MLCAWRTMGRVTPSGNCRAAAICSTKGASTNGSGTIPPARSAVWKWRSRRPREAGNGETGLKAALLAGRQTLRPAFLPGSADRDPGRGEGGKRRGRRRLRLSSRPCIGVPPKMGMSTTVMGMAVMRAPGGRRKTPAILLTLEGGGLDSDWRE